MTKICIAGAGGFIGSHLQEYVRETTDWEITTDFYSGADYAVHLAGHSQIDASIKDSELVLKDISKTISLLTWAKFQPQLKKFLYFSSDEVFGPKLTDEDFSANDSYNPYSPYAAGKAACEGLCMAWSKTYNIPTVITHCQNLFGERQPANKFVPTVVRCALSGTPVPIYVTRFEKPKRNFLHVRDACSAIILLLKHGAAWQKYNIATPFEISSEAIVHLISKILDIKIETESRPAEDVRPGFFLQHGINGSRLTKLGWDRIPIEISLANTVGWLTRPENRKWIGL